MGGKKMAQCQARNKRTGEQCRRRAVSGYNVCTVHGAGTKKRVEAGIRKRPGAPVKNGHYSRHFKEEVLQKIEDFRTDPDLEKLDFEIGYLKSLLARIEDDDDIEEQDKIVMLEKILSSIFKNMDLREKIKEQRRYSIGVEKLKLLVKYMFAAVQKHVDDPAVLSKIAQDLRELASKTQNDGEMNLLEG
jgi:hypothetical protein